MCVRERECVCVHNALSLYTTARLPEWLEQRELEELHAKEDKSRDQNVLSAVDFHYQEVSALLLRHSPESFTDQNGNPRYLIECVLYRYNPGDW